MYHTHWPHKKDDRCLKIAVNVRCVIFFLFQISRNIGNVLENILFDSRLVSTLKNSNAEAANGWETML